MGTILTPGEPICQQPELVTLSENYLLKDNFFSEFETLDEKSIARANIGAVGEETVYTKDETNHIINEKILKALEDYAVLGDLEAALELIKEFVLELDFVKADGSVPFLKAQILNALPTLSNHLTTKTYVDSLLAKHLNAEDPHSILNRVDSKLVNYAKSAEVYTKNEVYNKGEFNLIISDYVKKDGSTPFLKPQIGIDPIVDSHLTTLRYVKMLMRTHDAEIDPHGLKDYIRRTLGNYYTKSETYTKAQTYSRNQLDLIINSLLDQAVQNGLLEHISALDPHGTLAEVKKENYVKSDGSIPFSNPLKGVDAVEDADLVTYQLLKELANIIQEAIDSTVYWETSGPVQTTVGYVEDNSELPKKLTLQEIMDAIFYGKSIGIEAPEYAVQGESVCITVHIHGTVMIDHAVVYQNGVPVANLTPDMFEDDKHQICDLIVTEDTTWRVEVFYPDGKTIDTEAITKITLPVFVGTLAYWENTENNITFEKLQQLVKEDPENNKFVTTATKDNLKEIEMTYDFLDIRKRNLIVVVPNDYPDLKEAITPVLHVGLSAFMKTITSLVIPGSDPNTGMLYKIYLYKIPLVTLSQTIKYKF